MFLVSQFRAFRARRAVANGEIEEALESVITYCLIVILSVFSCTFYDILIQLYRRVKEKHSTVFADQRLYKCVIVKSLLHKLRPPAEDV